MKKRNYLIFLILALFLLGCGSQANNENINEKAVKQSNENEEKNKDEIDFEISDIDKFNKTTAYYNNNPEKFFLYDAGIDSYTMIFGYDYLYEQYLLSLTNDNNELEVNAERVADYLQDFETFEENFGNIYNALKNEIIPEIENVLSKGIDEKGKEVDEQYKEFIELTKEKINLIDEIKKYYSSGAYKKDNLSKGKKLHEQYLKNHKNTASAYKKAYNLFLEEDLMLYKNNTVDYLSPKERISSKRELIKARILLKMFTKEMYASSFNFEITKMGTITKIGNENYINNLKKIQKTLDKTISNLEKADKGLLLKEEVNPEKYDAKISALKEISEAMNKVIEQFETTNHKELMLDIVAYTKLSYILEVEFKDSY